MKNSKFALEFHQAEELEKGVEQMFQYAENPSFIEAACYFMKGAEALKNAYITMALATENEERRGQFNKEEYNILDKVFKFIGIRGGAL